MAILIGLMIGVAIIGNPLLGLFTETRMVHYDIYIILALTIILEIHSSFHADIYVSTNHFPFLIPAGITGIVIGLAGIPIAKLYGITGLVIVPFVASMIVNNWYPVYLSFKLTGWNLISYTQDLFKYGINDVLYRLRLSNRSF
jgi:hypothetical protein